MGMPLWAWVLFYIAVLAMLIIDLRMFGRKGQHEVNIREALVMTGIWIAVAFLLGHLPVLSRTERREGHRVFGWLRD